jgi:hypothetical protein
VNRTSTRPDLHEDVAVDAFLLRRNWYAPLFTLVLAVGGFAITRLSLYEAIFGWLGVWFGTIFTPVLLSRNAFRLARPAALRVSSKGLTLAGRAEIIAPHDIVEAKLVPRPSSKADHVVELVLRDRSRLSLAMGLDAALLLFERLGINPGERRTAFTTVVPYGKRFLVALLVVGAPSTLAAVLLVQNPAGVTAITFDMLPLCALIAWAAGLIRGKVAVGAEGITRHWLLWRRYTPFADVRSIELQGVDTIVGLGGARRLRLRALDRPETEKQRGAERRALFAHLSDAHGRWARSRSAAEVAPRLQRGGRSARDWLVGLGQLAHGDGYRVATLTPELLSDVVRSDHPIDARVGAALALVRVGGEHERAAVRIAAEACAEPATRARLMEIAEAASEAELEAVLGRTATTPRTS